MEWKKSLTNEHLSPQEFIPEEDGIVRDICAKFRNREDISDFFSKKEFYEIAMRVLLFGTTEDVEQYARACLLYREEKHVMDFEMMFLSKRDDPKICKTVFQYLFAFKLNLYPEIFVPRFNNCIELISPYIVWKDVDYGRLIKKVIEWDAEKSLKFILDTKLSGFSVYSDFLNFLPGSCFAIKPKTLKFIVKRWDLNKDAVFGSREEYEKLLSLFRMGRTRDRGLEKLLLQIPD